MKNFIFIADLNLVFTKRYLIPGHLSGIAGTDQELIIFMKMDAGKKEGDGKAPDIVPDLSDLHKMAFHLKNVHYN